MHADEFVRHALTLVPRVVFLLRLAFLEGVGRSDVIDGGQLARVYVFRNRLPMMDRETEQCHALWRGSFGIETIAVRPNCDAFHGKAERHRLPPVPQND